MPRRLAVAFAVVIGALTLLVVEASQLPIASALMAQTPARIDFARDVQPILRQHCIGCHGPSQQMNGLRLDRRRDAMRGGSAGGVIIRAGSGDISPLYLKVSGTTLGTQMPPTGALKAEQIAIVKQWIDEGADWPDAVAGDAPSTAPDPGAERLIEAVRSHEPAALARALKAHRAAINKRGDGGATALMWASLDGNQTMVRALLDAGADPNVANDVGATPLMWAIPDLPIVSLLLDRGAKVNVKTDDGRTPLMRAAGLFGASAVVRRLLDAGADSATQGSGFILGTSAVVEAAYAADPEIIKLLMARGADPAANGPAALYYALRADCTACVEALLEKTPPPLLSDVAAILSPPNEDGRHLLQLTARAVDVNTMDGEGRTLLMLAASSDRLLLEAVNALIAKGADAGARSKDGRTAADFAALRGRTPVLDALLTAGAPAPTPLPAPAAPTPASSTRAAVERSLPLLQKSAATFWKKSGCVSCHNSTLTAETLAAARPRRLTIDEAEATRQRETHRPLPGDVARACAPGPGHPGRLRYRQLHPARSWRRAAPCGSGHSSNGAISPGSSEPER